MKKLLSALALTATTVFSGAANAALPEKAGYVGISYGVSSMNVGAVYRVEEFQGGSTATFKNRNPKPSGTLINGGFRVHENWSIEGQYMITGLLDAPFFVGNEDLFGLGKARGMATGLYGVFQTDGDVFFRAKLGFNYTMFDFSGDINRSFSDFGISYGFSIGQKLGKLGAMEFNYMRYADVSLNRGDRCVILDSVSQSCAPDNAVSGQRYLTLSNSLRLDVLSIGYTFMF
ncbi:Uncharacterised protein [BD1-7 clade bacterium]|uniref:Outer membrane protein beta-barrel domain-containing protein n=1 Tax=BD1-7 clade bacterium TaxID=2029982 RepID=A0A5S9QF37_9GAMM|nr:Uncharacterised protein [BD1-7 clade bacterium]